MRAEQRQTGNNNIKVELFYGIWQIKNKLIINEVYGI